MDAPRDPKLQGRAGLVRVKTASADFAVLSVYLPPCFADNSIRRVWYSVMEWVSKSLDKLPSRCLPILCLDANPRVGKVACAGAVAIDTSDAVGQCEPELETPAGHAFKTFLEGQFMSAANTYFSAGKTFYPTRLASKPSRVDYICLPRSAIEAGRVSSCSVNEEAGDCLQLVRGHARADHRPLQMYLDVQLKYSPMQVTRWDFDMLSPAIRKGHASGQQLYDELAQWTESHHSRWYLALKQGPSAAWPFIAAGVGEVAASIFANTPRPQAVQELSSARKQLLEDGGFEG